MKKYQVEGFVKNGVTVNAVYVVKSGDTLSGIRKTVKRLGGNPKDIEKIDPSVSRGLAPGQFVYFHSDLPRAESLLGKVLNNHELERCSYQLVRVFKDNYKEKLDAHVGYPNAWIEVLALNRFQAADFANSPSVQFKVYHTKTTFNEQAVAQGQARKNSLDKHLAKNNEVAIEKVLVAADRAPASTDEHASPGGLVYIGLPILIIALVLSYYNSKKKIALDTTDL